MPRPAPARGRLIEGIDLYVLKTFFDHYGRNGLDGKIWAVKSELPLMPGKRVEHDYWGEATAVLFSFADALELWTLAIERNDHPACIAARRIAFDIMLSLSQKTT